MQHVITLMHQWPCKFYQSVASSHRHHVIENVLSWESSSWYADGETVSGCKLLFVDINSFHCVWYFDLRYMAFLFWCHRQYVRFIILCQENVAKVWYCLRYHGRDHFVYVPSQWEATLHYNVVSYWLGAYTKLSLSWHPLLYPILHCFSESQFLLIIHNIFVFVSKILVWSYCVCNYVRGMGCYILLCHVLFCCGNWCFVLFFWLQVSGGCVCTGGSDEYFLVWETIRQVISWHDLEREHCSKLCQLLVWRIVFEKNM